MKKLLLTSLVLFFFLALTAAIRNKYGQLSLPTMQKEFIVLVSNKPTI